MDEPKIPFCLFPTEEAHDQAAWLRARHRGIGGHFAAAIAGVNKFVSRTEVYLAVTGKVTAEESDAGFPARRGSFLEDFAANEYSLATGLPLSTLPMIRGGERPYMLASVDRVRLSTDGNGAEIATQPRDGAPWETRKVAAGIEIKCPTFFGQARYKDGPPEDVIVQSTWYMRVTGIRRWEVVVLTDAGIEIHPLDYDERLADALVEAVDEFWERHVVADVPPEPETADEAKRLAMKAYPRARIPGHVDETPETRRLAVLLAEAKGLHEEAEARAKTHLAPYVEVVTKAEADLLQAIGEHEGIQGPDWSASWKEQRGRVSYAKAVEAAGVPDEILERFRGEPIRMFRFKSHF